MIKQNRYRWRTNKARYRKKITKSDNTQKQDPESIKKWENFIMQKKEPGAPPVWTQMWLRGETASLLFSTLSTESLTTRWGSESLTLTWSFDRRRLQRRWWTVVLLVEIEVWRSERERQIREKRGVRGVGVWERGEGAEQKWENEGMRRPDERMGKIFSMDDSRPPHFVSFNLIYLIFDLI